MSRRPRMHAETSIVQPEDKEPAFIANTSNESYYWYNMMYTIIRYTNYTILQMTIPMRQNAVDYDETKKCLMIERPPRPLHGHRHPLAWLTIHETDSRYHTPNSSASTLPASLANHPSPHLPPAYLTES